MVLYYGSKGQYRPQPKSIKGEDASRGGTQFSTDKEIKMKMNGDLPQAPSSAFLGSHMDDAECRNAAAAMRDPGKKNCYPDIKGGEIIVDRPPKATRLERSGMKRAPAVTSAHATISLRSRQRPSLSEQLSAVGSKASEITAEIRRNFEGTISAAATEHSTYNSPQCTVPTSSISVGTLRGKYPAPVFFFADRCEFQFCHPYQACEVHMVMYYRDMSSRALLARHFSFHIPRRLVHFYKDYDPARSDEVTLEFAAASAADLVRRSVPELAGTAKSSY
jgi:hypothetical protein